VTIFPAVSSKKLGGGGGGGGNAGAGIYTTLVPLSPLAPLSPVLMLPALKVMVWLPLPVLLWVGVKVTPPLLVLLPPHESIRPTQ
jgi:hypothetical protein